MTILGISCYFHDAAAALVQDGIIIAATEEERFSRKKHDSQFPKHAIDFCLSHAGCKASDIDYVVFYEKPFRKFHRIISSSLGTYPQSLSSFREAMRIWLTQKIWIKQEIAGYVSVDQAKILFTEHHLAHAASAYYPSPFRDAAILTVDGVGEWATTITAVANGNTIQKLSEMKFPHSVGLLYSAYTAYLGFEVNEGEWKVMGLAPYGKPRYTDRIWKTVQLHEDGSITLDMSYFAFQYSDTLSFSEKLVKLLGPPILPSESYSITNRSADIAASIQAVSEEILISMAKALRMQTKKETLCLAGGVALNSVANYRVLKESGFKNIFIQPAAGDSGGALGAALYVSYTIGKSKRRHIMTGSYFGKSYSDKDIEDMFAHNDAPYIKLSESELISFCSSQIAKGKVIGWMQGRAEWGPRALGNRSILADARNPKMKEIINAKVKFREAFRPFAPSVLADKAHLILDIPIHPSDHYPLRYMLYVVPVQKQWRKRVPAITHIDNTTRPQLVYKETNPLYYKLISAFYKKTRVPLLMNTSFNLRGEPIVNSPEDAIKTFMRSGIDILVIGNYVCDKRDLK